MAAPVVVDHARGGPVGDDKTWTEYDAKDSALLEKAFEAKPSEVFTTTKLTFNKGPLSHSPLCFRLARKAAPRTLHCVRGVIEELSNGAQRAGCIWPSARVEQFRHLDLAGFFFGGAEVGNNGAKLVIFFALKVLFFFPT